MPVRLFAQHLELMRQEQSPHRDEPDGEDYQVPVDEDGDPIVDFGPPPPQKILDLLPAERGQG